MLAKNVIKNCMRNWELEEKWEGTKITQKKANKGQSMDYYTEKNVNGAIQAAITWGS